MGPAERKRKLARDEPIKLLKRVLHHYDEVKDPFDFGIELETCVIKSSYDNPGVQQTIARCFKETKDASIQCDGWGKKSVEFVYKNTFKRSDLDRPDVQAAFNKISEISVSCGDK